MGVLKLQPGALFNYEERQEYLLTFTVKDQFLTGLQSKELTIQVTNVNEEPVITTSKDIIQFNEDEVIIHVHFTFLLYSYISLWQFLVMLTVFLNFILYSEKLFMLSRSDSSNKHLDNAVLYWP